MEQPNTLTKNEFRSFNKIPRLNREMILTEKIDGTNAQVFINDDLEMFVGSRSRWITPANDNHGFAKWCEEHREELMKLGPGRHFGEWWGSGINRGYGLAKGEKRFSLFNVTRWTPETLPACVSLVPVLYRGMFDTEVVNYWIKRLRHEGSRAVPGYMNPEGVVAFHVHGGHLFKVTCTNDEMPKCLVDKQTDM